MNIIRTFSKKIKDILKLKDATFFYFLVGFSPFLYNLYEQHNLSKQQACAFHFCFSIFQLGLHLYTYATVYVIIRVNSPNICGLSLGYRKVDKG
jgi:hypothetical protein